MGQRRVGGAGRAEGGAGGGPGHARGPLKSAEKPRARSHWVQWGAGCVGGGGRGWKCGWVGVGVGGWGWQDAYGMGVGVGGWGGAGAIYRTSVGSHAGRGMKNVTNTNGARSHGSSGGAGCVGGGGGG